MAVTRRARRLLTERYGTPGRLARERDRVVLPRADPPAPHPNADRAGELYARAQAGLDDSWREDPDG